MNLDDKISNANTRNNVRTGDTWPTHRGRARRRRSRKAHRKMLRRNETQS